jgi:hypothetical protein
MRIRRCALTLNIFMNGFSGFSSVFSAAWSAPVATLAVAAASKVASVTTPLLLSSAEDTTSTLTTSASTAAAEVAVSLAPAAAANSGLDRNTAEAARRFTRANDNEDAKPARRPRKRRVGGGLNAWLVQSRRPHATKAALVVIAILMGKNTLRDTRNKNHEFSYTWQAGRVESRFAALGYTGGVAQQQAAAAHAQAQAQDAWRDESYYRQR